MGNWGTERYVTCLIHWITKSLILQKWMYKVDHQTTLVLVVFQVREHQGPCSFLVLIFAVVIISHAYFYHYLMLLLSPLHYCFALGRWFPNTNLEINSTSRNRFLYLRSFPYLKSRILDILVSWPTLYHVFKILHPFFILPSIPLCGQEETNCQKSFWSGDWRSFSNLLPVSQFCLKPALPWSSNLCPWPWPLTLFPSLPSLSRCPSNGMLEKTSFPWMPTFDQWLLFLYTWKFPESTQLQGQWPLHLLT